MTKWMVYRRLHTIHVVDIPQSVGYIHPTWWKDGDLSRIKVVWTYGAPEYTGVHDGCPCFVPYEEIRQIVYAQPSQHPILRDAMEEYEREVAFRRREQRITKALNEHQRNWVGTPHYDHAGHTVWFEWAQWDGPDTIELARLWRSGRFEWTAPATITKPASMILA